MLQLANDPSSEAINNHASLQFGVNGGTHNRVNSISAVAESAGNRKLAFSFVLIQEVIEVKGYAFLQMVMFYREQIALMT
ncbi:MAG: hypothetical protein CM15mV31_0130 [uncultured marine virus]|nr:MAG: hypothetical protein CM15mV31_0130 [uncultured marine virus]